MEFPVELAEIAETLDVEDLDRSLAESDLRLLLSPPDQRPLYTHYTSLDSTKQEIRLLKVWKTERDSNIHTKLVIASLLKVPEYVAVSYYWGPPDKQNVIYVDNEIVSVRESLYLFLDKLATRGQDLPIWVDALCINQNDTTERNEQVSLMSKIYSKAERVIAWIGEATPDSEYAWAFIQNHRHPYLLRSEHYLAVKRRARESLFHILSRPYWRRVWIVQEISLGKAIHLMCGSRIVDWSHFIKVAHAVLELPEHWYDAYGSVNQSALNRYNASERALIDSLFNLARMRSYWRKAYGPYYNNSAEIVIDFGSRQCLELKDKIYGFASLVPGNRLAIDYHKSFADIIFDILNESEFNVIMDENGCIINEETGRWIGVPFEFSSLQDLGSRLTSALCLSSVRDQLLRSLDGSEHSYLRSYLADFNLGYQKEAQTKLYRAWKFWPVHPNDAPSMHHDYPFITGKDNLRDPIIVVRNELNGLRCIGVCTQDLEKDHLSKFLRQALRDGEIQLCRTIHFNSKRTSCTLFLHHSRISILSSFDNEEHAESHFQYHRYRHPLPSLCNCDASAERVSQGLEVLHQATVHFKPQWTRQTNSFRFASDANDDSSLWKYTTS